jgi:AbrB family looped-hinge helix DNA binding protein
MDNPKTATRLAYELAVDENGALTLPTELREALGLQTGDTITLIQGDSEIWMMPTRLLMPEIAREMEHLLAQKGLTADDLLAGLAAEREKLFKEQYGDLAAP